MEEEEGLLRPISPFEHLLPPLAGTFPYHKMLKSIWRPQIGWNKITELEYYDLVDADENAVFSIAVALDDDSRPVVTKEDEGRADLLFPFDAVCYTRNGRHLKAFVFRPFKTLQEHVISLSGHLGGGIVPVTDGGSVPVSGGSVPVTDDDASFQKLIKGFLRSLIDIEEKSQSPWVVNEHSLVVRDGSGILLCIGSPAPGAEFNWHAAYESLLDIFRSVFDIKNSCDGIRSLMYCMKRTTSLSNRRRLLRSPFFLTARQIIAEFVPIFFRAATIYASIEDRLRRKRFAVKVAELLDWSAYPELVNILSHGAALGIDRFELLRTIRNVHEHLNEEYCKLYKVANWIMSLSDLSSDYDMLLKMINKEDADFAGFVFRSTYHPGDGHMKHIPLLDEVFKKV